MGCCHSRNADFSIIESKLESLRSSLKIININTRSIENETRKYIIKNYLDSNEIDRICSNLKISKEATDYSLINLLKEEGSQKICIQILVLFGILYGKDSREMKVMVLYKNYDRNNEDKLHPDDVKLMISDIFSLSVEKYLQFAISLSDNEQSEAICSYQLKLMRTKKLIILYFFHFIADGTEQLDSNWFVKLFKRRELNVLLDSSLFRKFASGIFDSMFKTQQIQVSSPSIDENIDLKKMRKFSKRLTKIT